MSYYKFDICKNLIHVNEIILFWREDSFQVGKIRFTFVIEVSTYCLLIICEI
jgi:hypothetical protein